MEAYETHDSPALYNVPQELISKIGEYLDWKDRKHCHMSTKAFKHIHACILNHTFLLDKDNINTDLLRFNKETLSFIREIKPNIKEFTLVFEKITDSICHEDVLMQFQNDINTWLPQYHDILPSQMTLTLTFHFCSAAFVQRLINILPHAQFVLAVIDDIDAYSEILHCKNLMSLNIALINTSISDVIHKISHIPVVKFLNSIVPPVDDIHYDTNDTIIDLTPLCNSEGSEGSECNTTFTLHLNTYPNTYINIGKATHVVIDKYSYVGRVLCDRLVQPGCGSVRLREITVMSEKITEIIPQAVWKDMILAVPKDTHFYVSMRYPCYSWYVQQLRENGRTNIHYYVHDRKSLLGTYMAMNVLWKYPVSFSERYDMYAEPDICDILKASKASSNTKDKNERIQKLYMYMDPEQQTEWFHVCYLTTK